MMTQAALFRISENACSGKFFHHGRVVLAAISEADSGINDDGRVLNLFRR
jgi:hypothetical protein